ncbi:MAG: para-aminobenzoate synthetase component [Chthoniobacter sp.]|nr:para-aminobenzoate synthetase component [Chthoniobacter sp.]
MLSGQRLRHLFLCEKRVNCDRSEGKQDGAFHLGIGSIRRKTVLKSIPLSRVRRLDLPPHEVAARFADAPGAVFFDSSLERPESISIVAAWPREIVTGKSPRDWETLRQKVRAAQTAAVMDDGAPRGMAAGYVSYDGSFRFGFYDDMLVYRHADQSWFETGSLVDRTPPQVARRGRRLDFVPQVSRTQFCEMVRRAQEYITAGDIYQVNLAHRFVADGLHDAWCFYETLRECSPAPYSVFLHAEERTILSASPERFLQISGSLIRTQPIKGTRPRHRDAAADAKSAWDLVTSAKETAELIMITDLERSDLGQICEFGSVQARDLLKLERFEQVFHLVSTIDGQLRSDVDHVTALQRCFPGGSVTGAPKKRAREIIRELEPDSRGIYTGAIGYFGFNGESQFNVAIRTVIVENDVGRADSRNGLAHFHVGAGIVADSDPEREYHETLDKAEGILLAAQRLG